MQVHPLIKFMKEYEDMCMTCLRDTLEYSLTPYLDENNEWLVDTVHDKTGAATTVRMIPVGGYNKTRGVWCWLHGFEKIARAETESYFGEQLKWDGDLLNWIFEKEVKISFEDHAIIPFFASMFVLDQNLVKFSFDKPELYEQPIQYMYIDLSTRHPMPISVFLEVFKTQFGKN